MVVPRAVAVCVCVSESVQEWVVTTVVNRPLITTTLWQRCNENNRGGGKQCITAQLCETRMLFV